MMIELGEGWTERDDEFFYGDPSAPTAILTLTEDGVPLSRRPLHPNPTATIPNSWETITWQPRSAAETVILATILAIGDLPC